MMVFMTHPMGIVVLQKYINIFSFPMNKYRGLVFLTFIEKTTFKYKSTPPTSSPRGPLESSKIL